MNPNSSNLGAAERRGLSKQIAKGWLRWLVVGLAGATAVGCDTPEPRVASATAGLPEYSAEESGVFDDVLTPGTFGLPSVMSATEDPQLGPRVRGADTVSPVRITTATTESLDGNDTSTLVFNPDGPPLAGHALSGPIELRFSVGNPSAESIDRLGDSLVGKHLVLFLKRYDDQGEPKLHFHGEADTPGLRNAIGREKALDALRGKAKN
jgi:hypothetical protein